MKLERLRREFLDSNNQKLPSLIKVNKGKIQLNHFLNTNLF